MRVHCKKVVYKKESSKPGKWDIHEWKNVVIAIEKNPTKKDELWLYIDIIPKTKSFQLSNNIYVEKNKDSAVSVTLYSEPRKKIKLIPEEKGEVLDLHLAIQAIKHYTLIHRGDFDFPVHEPFQHKSSPSKKSKKTTTTAKKSSLPTSRKGVAQRQVDAAASNLKPPKRNLAAELNSLSSTSPPVSPKRPKPNAIVADPIVDSDNESNSTNIVQTKQMPWEREQPKPKSTSVWGTWDTYDPHYSHKPPSYKEHHVAAPSSGFFRDKLIESKSTYGGFKSSFRPHLTQSTLTTYVTPRFYSTGEAGGLQNNGNTCYINAIIQSLVSLKPFVSDLRQDKLVEQSKLDKQSFYAELLTVIDKLQTANSAVNPIGVQNAINASYKQFIQGIQQDAHEFACVCLDCLEADIKKLLPNEATTTSIAEITKKDEILKILHSSCSPICRNFLGLLERQLVCDNCGHVTVDVTLLMMTSLNIPEDVQVVTLEDLFKAYLGPEKLEKACTKCEAPNATATQTQKIVALPRVIMFHLPRFKGTGKGSFTKLTTPVLAPKSLDLSFAIAESVVPPTPFDYKAFEGLEKAKKAPKANGNGHSKQPIVLDSQVEDIYSWTDETSQDDLQKAIQESKKEYERSKAKVLNLEDMTEEQQLEEVMKRSLAETHRVSEDSQDADFKTALAASLQTIQGPDASLYHLQAIVKHITNSQSIEAGHYVTDIYDPLKDSWQEFNDSRVYKREEAQMFSEKAQSEYYMFFYVHHSCWPSKESQ